MADRPLRELYRRTRRDERLVTVPNICSVVRVLTVPFIIRLLVQRSDNSTYGALALMAFAYLLDIFDGWYARKFHQTSRIGAMLDPLADKLLTNGVLVTLLVIGRIPVWFAAVIILRDVIYAIFVYTLLQGKDVVLKADRWGKVTTFCIAMTVLAYVAFGTVPAATVYLYTLKGICVSLIIGSALNYLNRYIGHIGDVEGHDKGGAV